MKKTILFLYFALAFLFSNGQTTLYLENFEGQIGKGATGSVPTVDLTGVSWTVDFSSAALTNNYRFLVRNNSSQALFEARNVGTSTWLSPAINISTHADVSFTINATESNANSLEDSDTVITQYRIDQGPWTEADINGNLSNDYGTVQISQANLSGTILEIRVIFSNDANNEQQQIDNVLVTGLLPVSYVYDNSWSPGDPNGVATIANDITVVNGEANFNANTSCNIFLVNPDGDVTINSGITLTVDNEMILESSSTQYSSLILDGSINGNVSYKRHVNIAASPGTTTTENDLISPPLTGQSFGEFRSNNSNILSGTIDGNPAFLFGPYDSSIPEFINYSPSDDGSTLNAGTGYRTGSTDNGTYTFTGTIETGNISVPITAGGASNWNLVGNPYPSYLKVQDFLNNTSNFSLMDANAVGIYGYDGTAQDGWTIYNLATTTPSTVITPGQGFFIDAIANGNMQFTPSMRTTGSSDDFILGRDSSPLVFLKIEVSNATKNFTTNFYFNDNATLGLDPGYDAKVWNNIPPDFSIYSYLVENNTGEAIALQTFHSDDLGNITIPLGVNTPDNSQITFSINDMTVPDGINVYLEDTVQNTSTLLNDNSYTLTPISPLVGTGRFYLRLVENQLSINDSSILESLNVYSDYINKSLVIESPIQQSIELHIFDVQGRLVKNLVLQLNSNKEVIDISNLTKGIYIVQLESLSGTKTQKVILK